MRRMDWTACSIMAVIFAIYNVLSKILYPPYLNSVSFASGHLHRLIVALRLQRLRRHKW